MSRRINVLLLAAVLAAGLAIAGGASAAPSAPPGWKIASAPERMIMSVADGHLASGAALAGFPVKVRLSAPDFDYGGGADPDHLVFTTAGSSTPLPYEVEKWDPAGTSTVWVRLPSLSSDASELDLYFGSGTPASTTTPSSVWDGDFMMVDHFGATGASSLLDSTASGPSGTVNAGSATPLTFGVAGENGSPAVAAGDGELSFGTDVGAGDTAFANGATYSVALYIPASALSTASGYCGNSSSYCIVGGRDLGGGAKPGEQFSLVVSASKLVPRVSIFKTADSTVDVALNPNTGSPKAATPLTAGWHDLTFTYDDTTVRTYVDGVLGGSYDDAGVIPSLAQFKATATSSMKVASGGALQPFILNGYAAANGGTATGNANAGFVYDDMQLSDVARSADWVQAQHLCQSDELVTRQPYETQGGSAPAGWQIGAAQERLQFQVSDPAISSTLRDFPVRVQLTPSDFDYTSADKDHLRFTLDADPSATALPYEVEHWDPSGMSTIWVKLPGLTSTAQTLDLYYDGAPANATSPTGVWDSGFMTVNHFNASDASTILDSTAHGFAGTPWNNGAAANLLTFGANGQSSPAIAAGAGEINFGTDVGSDDTGANSFHDGATYSVAFYVPATDVGAGSYDIIGGRDLGGGAQPGEQFSLVLQNGISSSVGSSTVFVPRVAIFKPGSSSLDETLNPNNTGSSPRLWIPATAGWHDLTLTYDNSTIRFYVDGVLGGSYADVGVIPSLADYKVSTSLPVAANGTLQPFVLNGYSNSTGNGSFTYDDMQLSSTARSADWVHAQHLTQTGGIATAAPASQTQTGGVSLAVLTPAAGASTAASFTLGGYVSVQSDVTYTLDGGSAVDAGQQLGAFSAPISGLGAGSHTLVVTAHGGDGSIATKTVSFTVDIDGPAIAIASPTDGQRFTSGQSFTIDASASDPAGVASTTIKLDGQTVQDGQTITVSSLEGGLHTFVVTSIDKVGNSSMKSIAFSTPGSIAIAHPAALFQAAGARPDAATILHALGATLPPGSTGSLVLSGFTNAITGATPEDWYAKPGLYSVSVSDPAAADGLDPVTARVEIVPVSVVTVAHPEVYFNIAVPPTASSILSAAGAKLTDGNGNTVSGKMTADVSGVGSGPGTSTVSISGTDMYGFVTAPVTVSVHVSAAVVAVAHESVTFADTGSAPTQAKLIDALGASVTGAAGDGVPVVDDSKVNWSVPGTYTVTVRDSDANDKAAVVTATIHVTVVPVPVVTLPAFTVYLPVSASNPLPAALLLANSGATLTDLDGNPLAGTLSADTSKVDGSVAGTYRATITGTDDYGDQADPVTVTVVIYLPGTLAGVPVILGTPRIGGTLAVDLGTWSPSGLANYQWLRDGDPIVGATGATYQPTADDVGGTVQVRVTESPKWYAPATATSAGVIVSGSTFSKKADPSIGGTPAIGNTLTADPGSWDPAPSLIGYQWLRDGNEIAGATGSSYTPVDADGGHSVGVRVTVSADGYVPAHATSAAVAVGAGSNPTSSTSGTVSGTVPATLSLTLGAPATFGRFVPGVAQTYDAATTATVTSASASATLSVSDQSGTEPGHLVNGAFALASPLQIAASRLGQPLAAYAPAPSTLLTYDAPVSNDAVTLAFKQPIGDGEPLLTGEYAKALTFTLSTTTP